jgi:hypothetical protein
MSGHAELWGRGRKMELGTFPGRWEKHQPVGQLVTHPPTQGQVLFLGAETTLLGPSGQGGL